jgi:hypothetical protein
MTSDVQERIAAGDTVRRVTPRSRTPYGPYGKVRGLVEVGAAWLSEGYRRGEDYAFVSWDGYVKEEALQARSLAKAVRP